MSRNTKAVLLVTASFWGILVAMGYLAFQYWQTQKMLQTHQYVLEDFSENYEEKNKFYKNNILRSMKQMQAQIERHPEGQKYMNEANVFFDEHLQPYNKLLLEMIEELKEYKELSRESLGVWKHELDKLKGNLKVYNDSKIDFRRQKLFDKCSLGFEEIKEKIENFKEVNDTLIWKSFLQDCILKSRTLEFEIREIGKSYVSTQTFDSGWDDIAIVPSARTLRYGEEFEASVFMVGAVYPLKVESIKINGKEFSPSSRGRATYKTKPSIGRHQLNTELTYRNSFHKIVTMTKSFEYEVLPQCK